MQITVSVKNVFGNETLYPACKTSAMFCALASTKTITQDMARIITANGYEIVAEAPTLRFATFGRGFVKVGG
jgi:hypothetical protein